MKVKIISNPYQKLISYEVYDENKRLWRDIADDQGYQGKLKDDKLVHGFFPFIVKEIVDDIVAEFGWDGPVRLFFEGTPDEYGDLVGVCDEEEIADKVDLQPMERTLNNADQVLPKIIEIFNTNIHPIIEKSASTDSAYSQFIATDLAKYSDAADDVIPIFVIGNYSAGKSTFINALIGNEILPSGDEAVTARICKIHQSKEEGRASLAFTYAGQQTVVMVTDNSYTMQPPMVNNDITRQLAMRLTGITEYGYAVRMNTAMAVLNEFSGADSSLDPIIDIHIPFHKGLWGEGGYAGKFVILDTPGSNAASHADHRAVLEQSMRGMSNGIPIYVATSDTLDSTDNESLYDVIKGMEGLDPRFTMIVVNKADKANLPREGFFSKEDTENILHQAIPRNLYSSGIYFVSSIMGLGSKNDGDFIDDYYDDIYESSHTRYADATSRHYKQLYRYDIMPEQMLPAAMEAAKKEAEKDRIFANSGLYSVEHAIQVFASKYASYNKCQQSQLFLGKIIDATKTQLAHVVEQRENAKWEMRNRLEQDRQGLIDDIERAAEAEVQNYMDSYEPSMTATIAEAKISPTLEDFRSEENDFILAQRQRLGVEDLQSDAREHSSAAKEAFGAGFQSMFKGIGAIKEASATVANGIAQAKQSSSALKEATQLADQMAAEQLIDKTNQTFLAQEQAAEKSIGSKGRDYWANCSNVFRNKMAEIVNNTSLSQEKKTELTDLIVSYRSLELGDGDNLDPFRVDEFDYLLNLGPVKLFRQDRINVASLSRAYENRLSDTVDEIARNTHEAYLNKFIDWEENLVNVVRANIVDYNPELNEQQRRIDEETARIRDLRNRQSRLQICANEISAMIDWQKKNTPPAKRTSSKARHAAQGQQPTEVPAAPPVQLVPQVAQRPSPGAGASTFGN